MVAKAFTRWKKLTIDTLQKIEMWWQTKALGQEYSPSTAAPALTLQGRVWGKRHNYAMLLCYRGLGYYGMQRQTIPAVPTVEWQLLEALHGLRLISTEEKDNLRLFDFNRASRTDKGVSAARQICSMVLPLGGLTANCGHHPGVVYMPQTVLGPLNELLPEDIRVIAIKRVTPKFNARRYCDSRHYTYTLPSYAFDPAGDADSQGYRIPAERKELVKQILSLYKGKRNFYNFTRGRLPTDRSCWRVVRVCECTEPFIRNGTEFLTVHLVGDSFMFHQIRKMIGLCIAIVRGHVGMEAMEKCWEPTRFDAPLAPGLGLVLHNLYFNGYYKRYEKTHEPVIWNEYEAQIQEFRDRCIDPVIYDAELRDESPMREWLSVLSYHTDQSERRTQRQNRGEDDEPIESDSDSENEQARERAPAG